MSEQSEVNSERSVIPDPFALAKRVTRRYRWYVVVFLAVLAVLGIVFGGSANWGDVATWTLAATTLLAFLAAVFAGLVAYDLLLIESRRDKDAADDRHLAAADRRNAEADRKQAEADRQRAERERILQADDERRAQASKVTAWFDYGHH